MKIKKVTGIYFSPHGSTKTMVEQLVHSLNIDHMEELDLTMIESRQIKRTFSNDELLVVIGFPVYADRLPVTSDEIFKLFKGNNTPTVAVVSYGNRDYGDALLELRNKLESVDFKVISGAAIIGEHCQNQSVATGRPDELDLKEITKYGESIIEKLNSIEKVEKVDQVDIKGEDPYRPRKAHLTPQGDDRCIQCGECFNHCPVNAISAKNTDPNLCIFCAKCIQVCPTNARDMKQESYLAFMEKLELMAKVPKEMETFF